MSTTPVIAQWGSFPPDYSPADWNDLLQQIAKVFTAHVVGDYTTFNWGSSTPAAEDQNKPWVKLNVDGSPDGLYTFFNGVWCKPHAIAPSAPYYRALWFGSEAQLRSFDGGDGTSDAPTEFTGAMWELDTTYPASFLCTPGTFATAGVLAVTGQITDTGVAGSDKHTLDIGEIPSHSHEMIWDRQDAAGGSQANCVYDGSDNGSTVDDISRYTENTGGVATVTQAHNNLPPFIGVSLIMRSARKYVTI
jgi:hypothetical protein